MSDYDSTKDTIKHIEQVRKLLFMMIQNLVIRFMDHDQSKLHPPEKEMYDEFTPKLKDTTYGSDEYKQYLKEMGIALEHHYQENSHHPEHYEYGIRGMSLLDLIEMLADWKAASLRHADGDLGKSLEINKDRFQMEDQLVCIFTNTAIELGWILNERK